MDSQLKREFRYLDTQQDRLELAGDIRRVRQSVLQLAESIPPERHYDPRYQGWSLAATLMHLNTMDACALWAIRLALVGIRPPLSPVALDSFNRFSARLFQRRLVATTLRGMKRGEARILNLVETLPIDRFTREVYHPPSRSYLTVERAMQQFFLFHWQEHLLTMQRVEGIYYEPPKTSTDF